MEWKTTMAKHVHGDIIEYTSDFIEGDIIKYTIDEKVNHYGYSKIIKVKAKLNEKNMLMLQYVLENSTLVDRNDIKEIIRKNFR